MKMSAMEMIVQIAGAPLVSALMTISNWYPLGFSSVLLVLAGLIAFTLPETHPQHRRTIFESPDPVHGQALISGHNEEAQSAESFFQMVRKLALHSWATSADFLQNPDILLSLGVFLLGGWERTCGHCFCSTFPINLDGNSARYDLTLTQRLPSSLDVVSDEGKIYIEADL